MFLDLENIIALLMDGMIRGQFSRIYDGFQNCNKISRAARNTSSSWSYILCHTLSTALLIFIELPFLLSVSHRGSIFLAHPAQRKMFVFSAIVNLLPHTCSTGNVLYLQLLLYRWNYYIHISSVPFDICSTKLEQTLTRYQMSATLLQHLLHAFSKHNYCLHFFVL